MGKITKQLQDERKKIDATIKCAQHALRRRPGDKTAKACLKFSEAKRKLVQHLEIRHKGLLVAMLAVICFAAQATNRTNTTLVVSDIQTLVNNSAAGDVIYLTGGSGSWASTLNINKAIWLIGYGTNSTTISGQNLIRISSSGVRVSGIRFSGLNPSSAGATCCPSIDVAGHCTGVRIDRCFFYGNGRTITTGSTGGDYLFGVIDHNIFVDCDVAIGINGDNIYTHFPQVPGSTNAVCIEDNQIYMTGGFASSYAGEPIYHQWAAHSIIRKNTINLTGYNSAYSDYVDVHGNVPGGGNPISEQSTVMVECYSNTFIGGNSLSKLTHFRGASLVVWSNAFNPGYTPGDGGIVLREEDINTFGLGQVYEPVTNSFFWGNTRNGSLFNPNVYGDSTGQLFLNQNYWNSPPNATNGIPTGVYNPYTTLAYPHPLVTAQDGGSSTNPVAQLTPSSLAWVMNPSGGSSNKVFTIKNVGGGVLTGYVHFANP